MYLSSDPQSRDPYCTMNSYSFTNYICVVVSNTNVIVVVVRTVEAGCIWATGRVTGVCSSSHLNQHLDNHMKGDGFN